MAFLPTTTTQSLSHWTPPLARPPNLLPTRTFSRFGEDDYAPSLPNLNSLLQAALHAAALRMQATLRPEPLIYDQYAACLVTSDLGSGDNSSSIDLYHYEIATRFIDDRLLGAVNQHVKVRQVVLLSDGMDTRPYRLPWPPSTLIFDVSTNLIFKLAKEKLSAIGAKVPKMCLLRHVSAELAVCSESQKWSEQLKEVGYQGDKPSIWVLQGLDHLTFHSFQDIVTSVSSLAMKGTIFIGDLPLTALAAVSEGTGKQQLEKVFMSRGFSVHIFTREKLAQELGSKQPYRVADGGRILFVAQQLRLSDDQVAKGIREMELAEEAGDEDNFEDW